MKRSMLRLALLVVLACSPGVCKAGMITMTITFPGASPVIITPGSQFAQAGSTNTSLQVDVAALNSTLSDAGSAYTFNSLGATSNFPGASSGATLTENGDAAISGPGNTTITIETVLSGYTTPTSATYVNLSSTATTILNRTTIGDTQTSNSSFNALSPFAELITPPVTFTSTGSSRQPFGPVVTNLDVGRVPPGYTLDTSATLKLTSGTDTFGVGAKLQLDTEEAVPEPSSLTLLGLGSLGLLGYGRSPVGGNCARQRVLAATGRRLAQGLAGRKMATARLRAALARAVRAPRAARSRPGGSGTADTEGLKVRKVGPSKPPPLAKVLTKAPVVPLYSKTALLLSPLTKRSPLGPNTRPTGALKLPPLVKVLTKAPVVPLYSKTASLPSPTTKSPAWAADPETARARRTTNGRVRRNRDIPDPPGRE
jgi:hypothetical protein